MIDMKKATSTAPADKPPNEATISFIDVATRALTNCIHTRPDLAICLAIYDMISEGNLTFEQFGENDLAQQIFERAEAEDSFLGMFQILAQADQPALISFFCVVMAARAGGLYWSESYSSNAALMAHTRGANISGEMLRLLAEDRAGQGDNGATLPDITALPEPWRTILINRPMSTLEAEEQRRSFAFGNCAIDNPLVTREIVAAAAYEFDAREAPETT